MAKVKIEDEFGSIVAEAHETPLFDDVFELLNKVWQGYTGQRILDWVVEHHWEELQEILNDDD